MKCVQKNRKRNADTDFVHLLAIYIICVYSMCGTRKSQYYEHIYMYVGWNNIKLQIMRIQQFELIILFWTEVEGTRVISIRIKIIKTPFLPHHGFLNSWILYFRIIIFPSIVYFYSWPFSFFFFYYNILFRESYVSFPFFFHVPELTDNKDPGSYPAWSLCSDVECIKDSNGLHINCVPKGCI